MCPYSRQILIKVEFSRYFEKYSNIIFNENSCNGSQGIACKQTDITKLILHFRDFVIAPTVIDLAEFILFTLQFLNISF
jgi:hypothetical protein